MYTTQFTVHNSQFTIHNSYLFVIGYGNMLRRDDGAGVALARRIAARWQEQGLSVRTQIVTQLTPELALEIAAADVAAVIFVDAAEAPNGGGIQTRRLNGVNASPSLGHHLDPEVLLKYAALFQEQQTPAWLVTIGGGDFGIGEGLSPVVEQLLGAAPQVADGLLRQILHDDDG
ncbi:MAG: hydrogenase [Chloroflexi bacterium]|nr:MAG: hydrogenase [Chloroflexota bacterium]